MAATAGNDGQYRPWFRWVRRRARQLDPVLMWAGHYFLWLAIPFIVLILVSDGAGRPGWLGWLIAISWAAWFATVFIDIRYHAPRLCERCMGATPLNPEAAAERWRPALRADHSQRFMFALLASNLLWLGITGVLLVDGNHAAGLPAHHDAWAYYLQDIPSLIILVGYFAIVRVHRDLFPWCPWCGWGKGGDPGKTAPDPDPEDHGVKSPS